MLQGYTTMKGRRENTLWAFHNWLTVVMTGYHKERDAWGERRKCNPAISYYTSLLAFSPLFPCLSFLALFRPLLILYANSLYPKSPQFAKTIIRQQVQSSQPPIRSPPGCPLQFQSTHGTNAANGISWDRACMALSNHYIHSGSIREDSQRANQPLSWAAPSSTYPLPLARTLTSTSENV